MSLILYTKAYAIKNIQTPFWQTSYSEQLEVQIKPLQPGVEADCRQYVEYLIAMANGLTAEDLEFARTLPLRGQMKDAYEVDFQLTPMVSTAETQSIAHLADMAGLLNYQIKKPLVSLELASIKNIRLKNIQLKNIETENRPNSFSSLSKNLGLTATPIELLQNKLEPIIRIRGRDAVCDLLTKNNYLYAESRYVISLSAEDILKMNNFYRQVEDKTFAVFYQNENIFVKAALLGYSYAQLYQAENTPADEIKQNIIFLFKNLFKPNTLELNNNWTELGDKKVIDYEKSVTTGHGPILLRM